MSYEFWNMEPGILTLWTNDVKLYKCLKDKYELISVGTKSECLTWYFKIKKDQKIQAIKICEKVLNKRKETK